MLVPFRKYLHQIYKLPMEQALFRSHCSLESMLLKESIPSQDEHLVDVHLLLGFHIPSNRDNKIATVRGHYRYYHYMQDHFNDKGWGCAYRSMQTICSWFVMQKYAKTPLIPMHYDIQKMLVDMDDKPKTFVGSSNWIGAVELSLCLSSMYNVKIFPPKFHYF